MTSDGQPRTRRQMLGGSAAIALLAAAGGTEIALSAPSTAKTGFPKGFRWGCATAAHQIEGNNLNSDFWLLENVQPTTFAERSGDTCDSYHRYEEDITLLAGLGFNTYRFSIEWARIEPSRGRISNAELDYYRRVIDCCRRHQVDPAVTFMHASAPRWFAEIGGWLNPEAPALFAQYCSTAARALAAGMAYAFTINEPQVAKTFRAIAGAGASYFEKHDEVERLAHAAAVKATGSQRFISMNYPDIDGMTPQLIAGHEQAFAAIKAERSNLPVSVTLNVIDFQPANEDSPYQEVRQRAYGEWLECVKRAGDFVAVQIYRQIRVPGSGKPLPMPEPMPFVDASDARANLSQPEALQNGVDYVYEQTGKPIFVSENGLETENDARRIWYIEAALSGLQKSIAKGVPVIGYLHWSLLDNFEWEQGYGPKFGLFAVDRSTFTRTPKPSAAHLGAIAKANSLKV